MSETSPSQVGTEAQRALLNCELEKGLASGVSKRTPEQIREAFRKARAAA